MRKLLKFLGFHVCEEFTQWQTREAEFLKTPCVGGIPIITGQHLVTRRWQERQCTLCGKMEQRQIQ
jgi:hypothetical protein